MTLSAISDRSPWRAARLRPCSGTTTIAGGKADEPSDRTALLAHAQRLEGVDRPGGDGPALYDDPGEHRDGRAVQARLPGDQPQQPHAGHRRPRGSGRPTHVDLRVRRDPAVPGPQDWPVLWRDRAGPRRN